MSELIDEARQIGMLICPLSSQVEDGAAIDRMPDDLLRAANIIGRLCDAIERRDGEETGTKTDLDAANNEVRTVMEQNTILQQEVKDAYQKGYRDALHVARDLAKINQGQSSLIAFYMQLVVDGWK